MAEAFAAQGAKISGHFHKTPSRLATLQGDLTSLEARMRIVELARKQHGPIDILIASAADFSPTPADTATELEWDYLLDLNLKAPFFLAQECAQDLKRGGVIVFVCDIHERKPLKGFSAYSASKGGLWTLTRSLAAEWAPQVRVNSLSPGPVLPPESFTPEQTRRAAARTLQDRIGTPQDIVEGAAFLIRNDYVTGFDLRVDGGACLE